MGRDIIGPWPASKPHGDIEVIAFMCINDTTNLVELTSIFEKSSTYIATCSEHAWIFWYPKFILDLLSNNIYKNWTSSSSQLQIRNLSLMSSACQYIILLPMCWIYFCLVSSHSPVTKCPCHRWCPGRQSNGNVFCNVFQCHMAAHL